MVACASRRAPWGTTVGDEGDATLPHGRRIWSWTGIAAVASLALPLGASAVVIVTGDGTGNTTAPADDPGFANVGVTSTGHSGVYLGDGWVLTANHVGPVAITLKGVSYPPVVGSVVRLDNPSGPQPDLIVYRINGFPALPAVVLSSGAPSTPDELLCIGNGWNRTASQTSWNTNWQEAPPPVYSGFKRGVGKSLRWGRNRVNATNVDVNDTRSITVAFDQAGGSSHEFQAVSGDSGGGCFLKRAGTWQLVGLLHSRTLVPDPNAPDTDPPGQPSNTAAYTNLSVLADVAYYRSEIEANTPPLGEVPALPPLAGAALAAILAAAARRALRTPGRTAR